MRQANVLIVDDDPLVRQDLKAQLIVLGHRVVGEAESNSQTLTLARTLRPDLVVLNLSPTTGDIARTLLGERIATIALCAETVDEEALNRLGETDVMGSLSKPLRSTDIRVTILLALTRSQERLTLEEEIKSLNDRMEARKLVGRAKAILMERHGLSERDAFKRIQSQSITLGKQAHEIAQAIITASEIAMGGSMGNNTGAGGSTSSQNSGSTNNGAEQRSPAIRPIRGEKSAIDGIQS